MRPVILAVIVLVCAAALAAAFWQRRQDGEISASEYGALYSLRRMDPDLFRDKILPELEKAMADGRLTRRELRAVEAGLGGLGQAFLKAAKTPSLDEQLGASLREAEKKAGESGRSLGDSLGKTFNDAFDYMLRKSEELSKKIPSIPRSDPRTTPRISPRTGPEPPATF